MPNHRKQNQPDPLASVSYRHIGYCIYCGSRKQLSREHVVPQGLGGNYRLENHHTAAVLGRASCEECRRITGALEDRCQTLMLGHLRRRVGLSQRPKSQQMRGIWRLADGSEIEFSDHEDKFPVTLLLPVFSDNPRLWDPVGSERHPVRQWVHCKLFDPIDHGLSQGPSDTIGVNLGFDTLSYQRMLAKIALGATILRMGDAYCTPIVNDFIRGIEPDGFGKYVFGTEFANETPPDSGEIRHTFDLRDVVVNDVTYLVCFLRLFANYGAPTNAVIVGIVN